MTYELKPDPHYPINANSDIHGSLERYLNHGIPCGSFLMAVLENNLMDAFGRADIGNTANMKNIVGYIYNHVPSNAWGSKERVAEYLKNLKSEGA
jgi:hypothetical protein